LENTFSVAVDGSRVLSQPSGVTRARAGLIGVVVLAVVALAGCDWAQFGFDPGRTNANPESTFTPASVAHLVTSWSTPCICDADATIDQPLIAGGLVYTSEFSPGDDNPPRDVTLRARDLATGAERWSTTLKQIEYAQFVGVESGIAYARAAFSGPTEQDPPPGSDVLLAFDASNGKLRWFRVPPAPGTGLSAIGDALVDGPRVFVSTGSVGSSGWTVSAIDAAGNVAWQTTVNLPVGHLVADAGHTIEAVSFVPLHPDQTGVSILTSFDETNGASTSRFLDIGATQVFTGFSFANGLLYTASQTYGLVAVHPGDGTRAWNAPGEGLVAVAPGSVVSATATGIAARNPLTGALIWNNTTAGNAWDQAVAGGVIIFVSNNTLQAFSLATGVAAGAAQSVPGFDPQVVAGDGRIVVANGMGLHVLAPSG